MQWQPIETAPKDGTEFHAFSQHNNEHFIARWNAHTGRFEESFSAYGLSLWPLSHWAPLEHPGVSAPDPDLARYRTALQQIVELDLDKFPDGRRDFYSGVKVFIKAWHLANNALRDGSGPTMAERRLRVPEDLPAPDLARVRALIEEWKLRQAEWQRQGDQRGDLDDITTNRFRARAAELSTCILQLAAALEGAAPPQEQP